MSALGLVDVVIPVFNQFEVARSCIQSVIASRMHNHFDIIVVDDASSDAELVDYLHRTAESGAITLIVNSQNLGFAASVNRGMRVHEDRDVLLLKSDTLVFGDWVERLRAGTYRDPQIATANPFSNASLMSCYPNGDKANDLPLEIDDEALDQLAAQNNRGELAFVHTTVGFCMFIKRTVLQSIGCFSQSDSLAGYGEDMDFCYRARKMSWKHAIVGDVFVKRGEIQSLGQRESVLTKQMIEAFKTLHPEFEQLQAEFRNHDPLNFMRQKLDLARLKRLVDPDGFVPVDYGKDEKGAAPVTLRIDFATGQSEFSVEDKRAFPNLVSYKLPDELVRFNSDTKFLGIDELEFSSSEDMNQFAGLFSKGTAETQLEPRLICGVTPMVRRAKQIRDQFGMKFSLVDEKSSDHRVYTAVACDDVSLKGPLIGLRISENFEFGNSFLQYATAIATAKKFGLKYIQVCQIGASLMSLESRFVVDDVVFLPAATTLPSEGCFLCGDFFDRTRFGPLPALESTSGFQELLKRVMKPLFPKIFGNPIPDEPSDRLVIHIRSGDIFVATGHPLYVQPPLAFYEMVIEKLIAAGRIKTVKMVYEDRLNPVIDALEEKLNAKRIPLICQCGEIEDDIRVLLAAKHMVFGFGSFCYAICMLSDQKETAHFFCPDGCSPFGAWPNITEFFNISDRTGNYIKLGDWINSDDQRRIMVEYQASDLNYCE